MEAILLFQTIVSAQRSRRAPREQDVVCRCVFDYGPLLFADCYLEDGGTSLGAPEIPKLPVQRGDESCVPPAALRCALLSLTTGGATAAERAKTKDVEKSAQRVKEERRIADAATDEVSTNIRGVRVQGDRQERSMAKHSNVEGLWGFVRECGEGEGRGGDVGNGEWERRGWIACDKHKRAKNASAQIPQPG